MVVEFDHRNHATRTTEAGQIGFLRTAGVAPASEDRIDTKTHPLVDALNDAAQIVHVICVGVPEAVWIERIDDGSAPPRLITHPIVAQH